MKIHLQSADGQNMIRDYGVGSVTINHEKYTNHLIITPEQIIHDWPVAKLGQLAAEHLHVLVELNPELVILGTGARLSFPKPVLMTALNEAGIGVEVMDTAAACRTYNILMGEGRKVAAALFMIES